MLDSTQAEPWHGRGGVYAPALAFVTMVAFTPVANYEAWTPKAALVPLFLATGLPMAVVLARRGPVSSAARCALCFLALAIVAAATSAWPTAAWFGLYGWGTGCLFCGAIVGAWAIGASWGSSSTAIRVEAALVAGAVLLAAVAMVQARFDLSEVRLGLVSGRPTGLMGSPVSLSQVLAGATAALVAGSRIPSRWRWPALAIVATGLELSGSRFAIPIVAVTLAAQLLRRRVKEGLIATSCVLLGFGAGLALSPDGSTGGVERLQGDAASTGISSRIDHWRLGADVALDHPLVGTGPGTFLAETSPRRTIDIAHSEGPDRVFADAHNIFVEYAVTVGPIGAAVLGLWLIMGFWRARGPLAWFALATLGMHLVQPQNVGATPLLFLCLGAAGSRPLSLPSSRLIRVTPLVLAAPAILAGGVLLFADFELRQSDLDFTMREAERGRLLMPRWKEPSSLLARNWLFRAITDDDQRAAQRSLEYRRDAANREPFDPTVWNRLGDLQFQLDDVEGAGLSFERALATNPQSVLARLGLSQVRVVEGDLAGATRLLDEADARGVTEENRPVVARLRRAIAARTR